MQNKLRKGTRKSNPKTKQQQVTFNHKFTGFDSTTNWQLINYRFLYNY